MATLYSDLIVEEPLWWLVNMEYRLLQRRAHMEKLDAYYRGDHDLPFLTNAHDSKMRDQFRRLLEESRSNFMRLVVDATEERLAVEGFRLSAETDATADPEAWKLWQANQMDAQSQTAFLESLVKGVSYLSVWADTDGDGFADIFVEDPLQTYVWYVPGTNHIKRAAALKVWLDDLTGKRRANVYLPDGIYKFEAAGDVPPNVNPSEQQQIEIPWSEMPESFVANPIGIVPIVPLRNRPRLLIEGESELEDLMNIQNQINGFLFLLALAGYFGAHRQRWVTGLELTKDANGKPVEPFNTAVDRLFTSEDPNVKFGEFSQTDLAGYINAVDQKISHISFLSRTPRHYLVQQGQSPSGDAIQSAESGLIKKVTRKQGQFGEGLEEAMRLARLFQGSSDSPVDSEIVWGDPQTHSIGTITDSVLKQYLGRLIPQTTALERLGFTQTQIRQIKATPDEEFAPSPLDDPLVKTAQTADIIRNIPTGA